MMSGKKQQDIKAAFGLDPLPDPIDLVDNLIESARGLSLQGHASPKSVTALAVELIARGATREAAAIMASDKINHIPFIRREGGRQLACKYCGQNMSTKHTHKCATCQKGNWAKTLETGGWAAVFKSRDRRGWVPEISKRPSRPADLLNPAGSSDRNFPPPPHNPKNRVTDTYRPGQPNADTERKSFREGADTYRPPRTDTYRPSYERSDPLENAFDNLSLKRRGGKKATSKTKRTERPKDDRKAERDAIKAERKKAKAKEKKKKKQQSTGETQNTGSEAPVNVLVSQPVQQTLPAFDITILQRGIDSLSLARITHQSQPVTGVQP